MRLIICICLAILAYIHLGVDPVFIQSLHRRFVGHEIIRGPVVNHQSSRNRFCGAELPFAGEMCPKLYTELASCDLDENGFSCPDIRRKGNTTLRQVQLAVTRMLRIFDLIARKYNMPYWIRSGSLIGAIRHNGFVPWDDDVDIEMPLMYYIDFVRKFSKELPDDMFFQTSETDPHHHQPKSIFNIFFPVSDKRIGVYRGNWRPKVRDKSSCYKYCLQKGCKWQDGLQLDIFVSDAIPWGIFPLREMTFEGFNVLVPNRWQSVIADEYPQFKELPRRLEFRAPKNKDIDPLHSCEELANKNNRS